LLASHLGLQAPFLANAALAGVVAIVAWFQVPETRHFRSNGPSRAEGLAPPPLIHQLRVLRGTPGFLLISLVSFVAFSARTGALFNIIPLLAESKIGLGPDQIGLGLGLISIIGLILANPSGVLVDRFGRKAVIVPATALTGAAMLLFAGSPSYALFLLACGLWSVASGIGSSAPAAYAADMAPPGMMASALGTYRTIADLGYVVGPLALGAMADLASPEAALATIAAMLFLSAAAFAYLAPESLEREDARMADT